MKTIYVTDRWSGYGKQNYYWNEYRCDSDSVYKFKCHKQKFFDGRENEWREDESLEDTWSRQDPNLPSWLRSLL